MLRSPLALALVLSALVTSPAAGQAPFATDEFSVIASRPAPGASDYLTLEGALTGGIDGPVLGLWAGFAADPLRIRTACGEVPEIDCDINGESVSIIGSLGRLDVTAAITLFGALEVGLDLPFALTDGNSVSWRAMSGPGTVGGASGVAIADPRLQLKLSLFGDRSSGAAMALVAHGTAPLGQSVSEGHFVGDEGPTFGGHAVAELFGGQLSGALLLGAWYRPRAELIATEVSTKMTYGTALAWHVTRIASILAEVEGATRFGLNDTVDQLEARLGARLRVGPVVFTAGGGAGIVRGPGIPVFHLLAGVTWAPLTDPDTDGDGVLDSVDSCPDLAEDRDGTGDEDGCPDEDNDADTVPDAEDRCPNEPEDRDGHMDEDGCPDGDDDGDGVLDGYDSCPNDPEDMDGDRDEDGCPDGDSDRDGIDDGADQCPNEAEDTDGLADDDGCPETDADGDGIADEDDECPEEPEDGRDGDGCPRRRR